MFAVIKTGGRQYRVVPDDVLEIGKIAGDVGTIVQLGEVLVVGGDTPILGVPTVAGATVAAEVLRTSAARSDRFQEAPPQEFAPQARLSRRDHGDPHHRTDLTARPRDRTAAEAGKSRGCRGRRRRRPDAGEKGRRKPRLKPRRRLRRRRRPSPRLSNRPEAASD